MSRWHFSTGRLVPPPRRGSGSRLLPRRAERRAFPRRIERHGDAGAPVYLSLVPDGLVVLVGGVLLGLRRLAVGVGPWGPLAGSLALLCVVAVAYWRLLPWIAARVDGDRERLVQT